MSRQAESFAAKYGPAAAAAAQGTKIYPETILAAASLESGYGLSQLASKYNNFFGIKASSSWIGKTISLPTKEQDSHGKEYTVNAAFRVYNTPEDSFKNYVQFISGKRYFTAGVHDAKTPQEQFEALHRAGYATDINYPQKLKERLAAFGNSISLKMSA